MQSLDPFPGDRGAQPTTRGWPQDSCQSWGHEVLGVSQEESIRTWPLWPGNPSQAPQHADPRAHLLAWSFSFPQRFLLDHTLTSHSPPAAGAEVMG